MLIVKLFLFKLLLVIAYVLGEFRVVSKLSKFVYGKIKQLIQHYFPK